MTTTIADVRDAIAGALATVSGLEVRAYLPDQITPPMATVRRSSMDPRMVFTGGTNMYRFDVIVFTQRSVPQDGEMQIDAYCEVTGDQSLKAAIETEANWPDSLVQFAQVTEIGETQVTEVAGVEYLSATLTVEVVW